MVKKSVSKTGLTRTKPAKKRNANAILAHMDRQYEANQATADRILKALNQRNAHVTVMVSSSGLRFIPASPRDAAILANVLATLSIDSSKNK